jgi:hypothetical protein
VICVVRELSEVNFLDQPDLFFDTDNREDDIEINCEDLEVRTLLEFEKVLNQGTI